MKPKLTRIICGLTILFLVFAFVFFIIKRAKDNYSSKKIISSSFVGYDFVRAISGNDSDVSMLLKPGAEAHSFEPTPEDIIDIKNADLFIYTGGESEIWIKKLLENNEIPKEKTLRLMDFIELKKEETPKGSEESENDDNDEYDEHIWTSLTNAKIILTEIKNKLISLYPEKEQLFEENYKNYFERLEKIDKEIKNVVSKSDKNELIFGDRFPFRYFVDEYDLKYYAAFPGCSEQTEASSNTISLLVKEAKEKDIHVVLKIELTSDKLAKTIADELNAKVLELNSAHNISQTDFENGKTFADIFEENVEVLREALK